MKSIYKSAEGEARIRERYLKFLKSWPVANTQHRIATSYGETFVIASGDEVAPPLLLLHGGAINSAMWLADIRDLAAHFRVYAIDLLGEPGLSAPVRPALESDAHAEWLEQVMWELSIQEASVAGVSLGAWMALDFAIRRPRRVKSVVAMCPAGIGRQKKSFALQAALLLCCGAWGRRKLRERVIGSAPATSSPAVRAFSDFLTLIHTHFRPRRERIPRFSDADLRSLTMPVQVIAGGRDALLDSAETKQRVETHAPNVEVHYLPEAGHVLWRQTERILAFLRKHGEVPTPL